MRILKADLVGAEMKRPFAGPLLSRFHAKYPFVKAAGALDVRDGKHDMVQRCDLHGHVPLRERLSAAGALKPSLIPKQLDIVEL